VQLRAQAVGGSVFAPRYCTVTLSITYGGRGRVFSTAKSCIFHWCAKIGRRK